MSSELTENLHLLHTTGLGAIRVRRNLALDTEDIVEWCRKQIQNAEKLKRRGKNWYVYTAEAIITVNAYSYTIITAHICKSYEG